MRLHRFHISETVGTSTELTIRSGELANQLRRVFRLKAGDSIVIFDGSGSEYTCAIASFFGGDDGVVLDVRGSARARFMPQRKVWLFMAIVKKDNFELIVEKATELGVTDIVPVIAERTEKKSLNEGRLRKIAVEASEQSGRGDVPVIHPIQTLKDALISVAAEKALDPIVFHTEGGRFDIEKLSDSAPLAVFIGPEGGWSPDELDMFHAANMPVVCLGPQVLRAETAVIAALSQVVFRL